jgi:hypothetical protein
MNAILGRLTDLGLRELLKVLTSAHAEGTLDLDGPAGSARFLIRQGHAAGELSTAAVIAHATRSGTFRFRPATVSESAEWLPQEELLARLDALARSAAYTPAEAGAQPSAGAAEGSGDVLAEMRGMLDDIPLPIEKPRVVIVTGDPRPYRTLLPQWRKKGWDAVSLDGPEWPAGAPVALAIVHLPASGRLARERERWLTFAERAVAQQPPAAVVWVGGFNDPWLRHQAIMAGAEFMLQAPPGETGETMRWFREELTAVAERAITRKIAAAEGDVSALREFFLALHADAPPAEVRASLLRLASSYFVRGMLIGVGETGFDVLGAFGFTAAGVARLARGIAALEAAVVQHEAVAVHELPRTERIALGQAVGVRTDPREAVVFPLLDGAHCVALFVGDQPVPHSGSHDAFAALLSRTGALLGR